MPGFLSPEGEAAGKDSGRSGRLQAAAFVVYVVFSFTNTSNNATRAIISSARSVAIGARALLLPAWGRRLCKGAPACPGTTAHNQDRRL